jgi:ribosomal protein L24
MSRIKTHVKKGDEVEIITGNHKGKRGTVLLVKAAKGQVVVEGVRPVKKATKAVRSRSPAASKPSTARSTSPMSRKWAEAPASARA